MDNIKTKYLEFISESRYKTHGLVSVKRTLPKVLNYMKSKYNIEYNYDTDDFSLYFSIIDDDILNVLISRSELLGYYPSVFSIDGVGIKHGKTIDEFVNYLKNYKIPTNYNEIFIQFESWLDKEIETPRYLYHVFENSVEDKIKRYGIYPKSKHKISYHPDRIYLTEKLTHAIDFIKQLDKNKKYSIAVIDKNLIDNKYKLLLRKDPNYNVGFYTTQNIHPEWISKIIKY